MSNEPISPGPELKAIEAALGSLVPARSAIDRDRVMFRAGQASVRSSRLRLRTWNLVAASLAFVAVCEGILLAHRPPPRTVVVVREPARAPINPLPQPGPDEVPVPLPSERSFSLGQTASGRLAAQVLRYGLDGLPPSPTGAAPASGPWPPSAGQMLQEEVRRLLDPGDPS
jgi:hypothetical protein